MAAARMVRKAAFDGATHTDESLASMRTAEIATLVAAMRGGNPPKPATKARAIELFWLAAKALPKAPEPASEAERKPKAKAKSAEAAAETEGAEKTPSAKPRKAKMYSVRIDGPEAAATVAAMLPQARLLAEAMSAAGRPLTMLECSALLSTKKASARPEKIVAWYFARVFRVSGILTERKGSEA